MIFFFFYSTKYFLCLKNKECEGDLQQINSKHLGWTLIKKKVQFQFILNSLKNFIFQKFSQNEKKKWKICPNT